MIEVTIVAGGCHKNVFIESGTFQSKLCSGGPVPAMSPESEELLSGAYHWLRENDRNSLPGDLGP